MVTTTTAVGPGVMSRGLEPLQVLLVEDDAADLALITSALAEEPVLIDCTVVRTLGGALKLLDAASPACILLDLGLPDSDPDETMQAIAEDFGGTPVIVLTGTRDYETGKKALSMGAQDFLVKGTFDSARLVRTIEFAIERQQAESGTRHRAVDAARAENAETTSVLASFLENAPVGIGFVDREYRFKLVNDRLAEINGVPKSDHPGRKVAEVIPDLWPQIEPLYERIITTGQPILNSETVGSTAADPGAVRYWITNLYPVVSADAVIGIGVIVLDVTELKVAQEKVKKSLTDLVNAMAATVDSRDPYTAGHQERVAILAEAIGHELGLDNQEIAGLRVAATIHDLGKIAIPVELLTKPGALTTVEGSLIREHVRIGFEILRPIEFPWPVAEIVHQHHERIDGSGYPAGLTGDSILIGAKVIAVADTVEAMSAPRPYRAGRGLAAALAEIEEGSGTRYDAAVVAACLRVCGEGLLPWERASPLALSQFEARDPRALGPQ